MAPCSPSSARANRSSSPPAWPWALWPWPAASSWPCGGPPRTARRAVSPAKPFPCLHRALRGALALEEALAARRSVRDYAPGPLTLAEVGQLLWAAQGVTSPEGFRTAPSAGALYPLELYLVVGEVEGLAPGVYHYEPESHALTRIIAGDLRRVLEMAALGQDYVRTAAVDLVLTGVYQRTARRYGERAQRYVHMEAGHAGQNVYLQAEALGLGTVAIGAFNDEEVQRLLSLPAEEAPLYIMPVGRKP